MDDLISRQAAIDAVCMEWCGVKHQDCKHPFDVEKDDYYWCDGCETALRTLPDLPAAEPERKKGKWVEVDDFYNRISGRCSVCGWEAHMYEDDVVGMKFCPNCGAEMRGDQDDSV